MFNKGVYSIFSIMPTNGSPEERFVARFLVDGKNFNVLEDHSNLLSDSLPNGLMDPTHFKILWRLMHSGYHKVVPENEINEGHYQNLIPDLDLGYTEPDQEYLLTGPMLEAPKRVEMFGQNVIVDGQKLKPEELQDMMDRIHSHELKLIPLNGDEPVSDGEEEENGL